MSKTKAVSDEEIIAALIANGTVKAAAAALGITTRTIYDRHKEKAFRADLERARNDVLRASVNNLTAKLDRAVNAVAEIMENAEVNPAVRLQAAQTIINNATKLADAADKADCDALDTERGTWEL